MTLCNNGFPLNIVQIVINNMIIDFDKIKPASVQRGPVYLRFPWLGRVGDRFAKQISQAAQKFSFSTNPRVVFNTKPILTSIRKNGLLPPSIIIPFIDLSVVAVYTT